MVRALHFSVRETGGFSITWQERKKSPSQGGLGFQLFILGLVDQITGPVSSLRGADSTIGGANGEVDGITSGPSDGG